MSLNVDRVALQRLLDLPFDKDEVDEQLILVTKMTKVREGKTTKLVLTDGTTANAKRDPQLIALLAEALATRNLVLASPDRSIRQIAADEKRCRHRMAKLIRLSWLPPQEVAAIVDGLQPATMTPRSLLEHMPATDWHRAKGNLAAPLKGVGS